MKRSSPWLIALVLTGVGILMPAEAIELTAGQRTYLLHCKGCHGNGVKGAAMKKQDEWNELFEADALLLREKHAGTEAAPYFGSRAFGYAKEDLYEFLFNYAADSGNVPSCL